MKEINWEQSLYTEYGGVFAQVGNLVLYCYPISTYKWFACASINEIERTLRRGPYRKSMKKAQEDAVQLANELLLDLHRTLIAEMKNFDLLEEI